MNVISTRLPGVLIIEPQIFADERGFFLETYSARRYAEIGLPTAFVQDNHSRSAPSTIRGFHYQVRQPQGKLVRCVRGSIFDVAVDIRRGSPTFGDSVTVELSAENKLQLYVPPGFAHAFCVPSEASEVEYKCTDYYFSADESGVIWNDPTIDIKWPVTDPIISDKDLAHEELDPNRSDLPLFTP